MREIDGYLLNDRETKDCISLIRGGGTLISAECVEILRHIFDARIDHCNHENYIAWTSARDIVEYALAGNMECLKEYDYLLTREELQASLEKRLV